MNRWRFAVKKLKLSVITFVSVLMLSSCSHATKLSEQETDMFAEYISKEVLSYDQTYDQGLIPQKLLQDNPKQPVTETNNKPNNSDNTEHEKDGNQNVTAGITSLNNILGTTTIKASYLSYQVYEQYPDNSNEYFVIQTKQSERLLVVRFELKNESKKDRVYNNLKRSLSYQLTANHGEQYSPLFTLLENDLQFMNRIIPAGSTAEGILVFRIPKGKIDAKYFVTIKYQGKTTTIEL